jgi:hypothetical protein
MIIPILITLLIIVIIVLCAPRNELFSASGLSLSDEDCRKLVDVYYKPTENSPECRDNYMMRICGKQRRSTIDPRTGNYYTQYGVLI